MTLPDQVRNSVKELIRSKEEYIKKQKEYTVYLQQMLDDAYRRIDDEQASLDQLTHTDNSISLTFGDLEGSEAGDLEGSKAGDLGGSEGPDGSETGDLGGSASGSKTTEFAKGGGQGGGGSGAKGKAQKSALGPVHLAELSECPPTQEKEAARQEEEAKRLEAKLQEAARQEEEAKRLEAKLQEAARQEEEAKRLEEDYALALKVDEKLNGPSQSGSSKGGSSSLAAGPDEGFAFNPVAEIEQQINLLHESIKAARSGPEIKEINREIYSLEKQKKEIVDTLSPY